MRAKRPLVLCLALWVSACGGATADDEASLAVTSNLADPVVVPLASAAAVARLEAPSTTAQVLLQQVQTVAGCRVGYRVPVALTRSQPVSTTLSAPLFYTSAQLDVWRARVGQTRAQRLADLPAGAPDDWQRMVDNAARFQREGEPLPHALDDGQARATHGSLARDAAYHYVITQSPASLQAVRRYLKAQAIAPVNDFGGLCFVTQAGQSLDGWFWHASWLLRYVVTFDAVRAQLPDDERLAAENLIRRNAYVMAAHLDWGLAQVFPGRLNGDYARRLADAAPAQARDTWWRKAYDSNGDCQIDNTERAQPYEVRAYVHVDGSPGPRLSVLSQWFNNRRSAVAASVAASAAVLDDALLRDRSRRYFMEWLSYAVWPDGSEGEYARNGDYCVAQQGVIYAQTNLQAAWMTARLQARQGDASLLNWQTCQGLFGTACAGADAPKSLQALLRHQVALHTGALDWYAPQPWRAQPQLVASMHLGGMSSRYLNGARVTDNYHELALLYWAGDLPQTSISGWILRDPAVTNVPFPGLQGHAVSTGFGSWVGAWTDVFNAMPAVLLLRP